MLADGLLNYIRDNKRARGLAMQAKDWSNQLLLPANIRRRQRSLDEVKRNALQSHIKAARNLADDGAADWEIDDRLRGFRNTVIPWLAASLNLDGCRVLEVGCGSGASTLALAEQGANVVGLDIDPICIDVGQARLAAYDATADLRVVDGSSLPAETFDLIIFFASLEHMTQNERLKNLSDAWELLGPGGRLCVIETPNRLWSFDDHTSALPFFDWLPDTLAVRYAVHSRKLAPTFGGREPDGAAVLLLTRHGRGLSFHEFEVASIPCAEVESCMVEFLRRNPIYAAKYYLGSDRAFSRLIRKLQPNIAAAFFYHRLDLLIRKP